MTLIYEFPSEKGDIGPFESNQILWMKYNLCPLKSCFSADFFWCGHGLFNSVVQSLHNAFIQIELVHLERNIFE